MTSDSDSQIPAFGLPKRLLICSLALALLTPFVARVPGLPFHGWEWLADYLAVGMAYLAVFNLIPGFALFGIGKASRRMPLAFWCAAATMIGFFLWAHGTINLHASSTAVIGLVFIPIYSVVLIAGGWVIGMLAHVLIRAGRWRFRAARIVCAAAALAGCGLAVHDAVSVSNRESQFPIVRIKELPLAKRVVFADDALGHVDVLALADFDADPGNEIGVLGSSGIALLEPGTYRVKARSPFAHESCDDCVHMYPSLIPDGAGDLLVITSNGISDRRGRLLWKLKAEGFTRLVPMQPNDHSPTFFSYRHRESIDRHNPDGTLVWRVKTDAFNVGIYETPAGEYLPFALSYCEQANIFKLFGLDGEPRATVPLPNWASQVTGIAWPERGCMLAGSGSRIGILNAQGDELFRHAISDTSFSPYHGPDGAAVRFDSSAAPYLAVASHGSSGYARSALLIFDPDGCLVWQEELHKLHSIIAAPDGSGEGDVLLAGGDLEGIIEYRLEGTITAGGHR